MQRILPITEEQKRFLQEKVDRLKGNMQEKLEKFSFGLEKDLLNFRDKFNKSQVTIINIEGFVERIVKSISRWFLYVVQEPSFGLYYVQNHLKETIDTTITCRKEMNDFMQKAVAIGMDMNKTRTEIEEISDLNIGWAGSMSSLLDELYNMSKKNLVK